MSAIGKKKQEKSPQILGQETSDEILQRRRAIESRVGVGVSSGSSDMDKEPAGMAAEKAVGALCFLPKSLHRLATRAAEDRDLTAKRFFMESLLIGLEQQGVITPEQRVQALTELPPEYGWKGRRKE